MKTGRTNIKIGGSVELADAWERKVTGLTLALSTYEGKHLLVERSVLPKEETVVPLSCLDRWFEEGVHLALTQEEFGRLPSFQRGQRWGLEEGPIDYQTFLGRLTGPLPPAGAGEAGHVEELEKFIILGKVPTQCTDGRAGILERIILDPGTKKLTYLVVRRGWLTPKKYLVPVEAAVEVGGDRVFLQCTLSQLKALPKYYPDEELRSTVYQVLENNPSLAAIDASAVRVEVVDGMVDLSGNVRFAPTAKEIESVVQSIPGVLGLNNSIANDRDLEVAVAGAIDRDEGLARQLIVVRSFLGRVTLEGAVPSDALRQRAAELAAQVPGVTKVVNQITVSAVGAGSTPAQASAA